MFVLCAITIAANVVLLLTRTGSFGIIHAGGSLFACVGLYITGRAMFRRRP
ncbi:hypothetical protein KJZ71_00085 [Patescibacteria group bacterium]|uniref:Uncharacterized protein n=1 Tax=candidate division WWE3 bacterium TaxID=2053526 RepID=A0A928Y5U7_UNCKA|nr:hypothetical protein [candidate division WWE3 bacterium]MCL4732187.1 hypothetical protein [Patescibacteria group bacterium]